jgi:hypothetical protein
LISIRVSYDGFGLSSSTVSESARRLSAFPFEVTKRKLEATF